MRNQLFVGLFFLFDCLHGVFFHREQLAFTIPFYLYEKEKKNPFINILNMNLIIYDVLYLMN